MNKLTDEEIAEFLRADPEWTLDNEKLYQKTTFENFTEAFASMAKIATIADALDHHPEWKNIYNVVEIWLTTHDAGGITRKDLELAARISEIA